MRLRISFNLREFDWVLFIAAVLLSSLGLAAIYSIALAEGQSNFDPFIRQAIYLSVGVLLMFLASAANHAFFRNTARIFYFSGIALLAAVLFLGVTRRGTTGWFSLFGLTFQPVEFMKAALTVALARFFMRHPGGPLTLKLLFTSVITAGVPTVLVFAQPDFGSAILLAFIWLGLAMVIGLKKSHMAILGTLVIFMSLAAWFFVFEDYQRARVSTFLKPTADPLGQGYNVTQAIIAIGAGQFFGRGLGFGSQSQLKFLPESKTDFIFAVIAEELGFAAVAAMLFFFGLFFYRAFRIARKAGNNFNFFLAMGVIIIIAVEAIINIGMNIGLLPVTGITLPFLSYGGSSLIAHFALVGLLEHVATRGQAIKDDSF